MNYTMIHGDSIDMLKQVATGSIKLVVSSPPYNIGKAYEKKTSMADYLSAQSPLIAELCRVLDDSGSICWQSGCNVIKGEIFPLDIFYYDLFKQHGLTLRNRIIWHFGHGLHCKKRFSGRYETLLWFTKGDNFTFNLDPVRVPSKEPGKRHFKGPKKGQLSGNPLGKNPSDFWTMLADEWSGGVWEIPNVKSNHPEKTEHPCQFPVELAERCVLALTNEGDTVLDPYAGVGSSLLAALMHGRSAIGGELKDEYVQIANRRVESLRNGTLKTRPIGKPIYDASQKSTLKKQAQLSLEWHEPD